MGLLVGLGGDGGDKPGVSATVAYKELAKVFHCISSGVLVCRLLQGVTVGALDKGSSHTRTNFTAKLELYSRCVAHIICW